MRKMTGWFGVGADVTSVFQHGLIDIVEELVKVDCFFQSSCSIWSRMGVLRGLSQPTSTQTTCHCFSAFLFISLSFIQTPHSSSSGSAYTDISL